MGLQETFVGEKCKGVDVGQGQSGKATGPGAGKLTLWTKPAYPAHYCKVYWNTGTHIRLYLLWLLLC